jgi:hypothetical protein
MLCHRGRTRALLHCFSYAAYGNDRVDCASTIAGRVATGSERISYAGLQIAFAFFYSVFQGYAPDTDLDNVRDRVVGILFGLIVTGLVFQYIWPERKAERIELPSST